MGRCGCTVDIIHAHTTGVQLKDGTTLTSDLVVDAAGRASQSSTWLKELGYDTPEEVSIDANVVYNAVNVKPKHDMVCVSVQGCAYMRMCAYARVRVCVQVFVYTQHTKLQPHSHTSCIIASKHHFHM